MDPPGGWDYRDIIMSWKEYHSDGFVRPFSDQTAEYKQAIATFAGQNGNLLSQNQPKRFLLGGFHHLNSTIKDFLNFCGSIHPHQENRYLFLDMCREPLLGLKKCQPYSLSTQASLAALPFRDSSLDLLFLDFTLDFMTDRQVSDFAISATSVLSPDGLVIAALADLDREKFKADLLADFSGKRSLTPINLYVKRYFRYPQNIISLLDPLKPIFWNRNHNFNLLVLSHPDSQFPALVTG